MTTQNIGSFAQPMPPLAQPRTKAAVAAQKRIRFGDRYFTCLCLVLFGYAAGGRGFAYWGIPPIGSGEVMLVIGVFMLLKCGVLTRLLSMREWLPLMAFMSWGCVRTIPYLDIYGKDTIRDAVIWGYGTYAFIVAALLISNPARVQKLVINYRKFVIAFLLIAPFISVAVAFFEGSLPQLPWGVPIVQVKAGDLCVHLAGCFAYIVALGRGLNPWFISFFMPLNLGLNIQGRAGMVAFAVAIGTAMVLRPFHPRAMRIFFVIGLALFILWATNFKIQKGPRELSFNQLVKGFSSIFKEQDDEALDGSKQWRMQWWTKIINYTFYGQYFWTGKGFGINLATDDGFQTDDEASLRSPHNGHMTMLARTGVPGLSLWAMIQLVFAYTVVRAYIRARKRKHMNWSGLFMFLGTYWAAFVANATFDVFLEGPMGGIWFWCIYGAGIGSAYVYKRMPDLLTPPPAPQGFAVIVPPAHAIR